jgi:hypothetical protein
VKLLTFYSLYTISALFLSCAEHHELKFNHRDIEKSENIVAGYPCNSNCIWSSYSVNMNIQEGKVNCNNGMCACVKKNDAYTLCESNISNNSPDISDNTQDVNAIKNIPYYNQYENKYFGSSTCQNTSVAMALTYFESRIHPDSIYDDWGKDIAQSPSGLNQVYSYYAKKSKIETNVNASPEDLKNALLKGEIVIVHGYFTNYGHVLLVRGFDGDKYYVNDPAGKWSECFKCGYSGSSNGITSYKKKDFENAIFTSDGNTYLPGWIHTISAK